MKTFLRDNPQIYLLVYLSAIVPANCLHDLAKTCAAGGRYCITRPHDCLSNPKFCNQVAAVSVSTSSTIHVEIWAAGSNVRNRWVGLAFSEVRDNRSCRMLSPPFKVQPQSVMLRMPGVVRGTATAKKNRQQCDVGAYKKLTSQAKSGKIRSNAAFCLAS